MRNGDDDTSLGSFIHVTELAARLLYEQKGYDLDVRYFRNPCDRDPPTAEFQKLEILQKFPKNTERLLLGNERLLLGNERLLLGNERLLLGIIGVFGFF